MHECSSPSTAISDNLFRIACCHRISDFHPTLLGFRLEQSNSTDGFAPRCLAPLRQGAVVSAFKRDGIEESGKAYDPCQPWRNIKLSDKDFQED
jgi:hypothetical protein